jgi:hypothetical protein
MFNQGAESLSRYCYEKTARDACLLEVYECLAQNKVGMLDGWGGTLTGGRPRCLRENTDERRRRVGGIVADAALPI